MLKRLLIAATVALASMGASTINPNLPQNGQPYSASVIRGQFQAAINDIQALQSMNAGTSAPFSCTLANEGAAWLNNTSSPFSLNICDGNGTWVPYLYLDTTNHIATPVTGRGSQQTIIVGTTTDLGSVPQSSILASGNSSVSITSLGGSAKAGDIKIVQFNGTNTLVYNATSLILPGATNYTVSAGSVWIFESLGSGNWLGVVTGNATGVTAFNGRTGSVSPQSGDYTCAQVTNCPTNTPTLAPAGASINASASLASAGATVTITADAVVVGTALNGTTYVLPSYSQAFASAGTGAGGMDTGTLPSSGYVCIYAIYNPNSPATSILGSSCANSSGTIYSGGHMPSGYTASALIAAWPTNGSPNMVAGYVLNRTFFYQLGVLALSSSTTNQGSITSLALTGEVPPNAHSAIAIMTIATNGSNSAGTASISLFPASTGSASTTQNQTAGWYFPASVNASMTSVIGNIDLTVAQTTYYATAGIGSNVAASIGISGYSW